MTVPPEEDWEREAAEWRERAIEVWAAAALPPPRPLARRAASVVKRQVVSHVLAPIRARRRA